MQHEIKTESRKDVSISPTKKKFAFQKEKWNGKVTIR
jgi:hypothetical protein